VIGHLATLLLSISLIGYGTTARSQSLAVQEQCASQARKTFQELESENRAEHNPSTTINRGNSDYQSHYNSKLDKCLMLIHRRLLVPLSTDHADQQRQSIMIDANERRHYAIYAETQLAAELAPKLDKCELVPGMRFKTACKSREEFDAFVASYMEQ
jgi:hypothetical protein